VKPEILLFDVDDTLYSPETGIWDLIGKRIDLYINLKLGIPPGGPLRKALFKKYGTTMRGLQAEYGIDPHEYLKFVHEVPLPELLSPNPTLRAVLERLPYPKVILTNSDRAHASRVTQTLGIYECFGRIIDILDLSPYCKPQPEAFLKALEILGQPDPGKCLFFEDSPRNIQAARAVGMLTVHVSNTNPDGISDYHLDSIDEVGDLFGSDFSLGNGINLAPQE
jgi:putative hydrolase of the HAD superfamily